VTVDSVVTMELFLILTLSGVQFNIWVLGCEDVSAIGVKCWFSLHWQILFSFLVMATG
jgi:hypothetical protein